MIYLSSMSYLNRDVFNPYLPEKVYIPDGEPRVFDNRVYIYGSHDKFNGFIFCLKDYICYSAPVDDLSNWRFEGIIYKKKEDPINRFGLHLLFAPDVVRGLDGRFYLYYGLDFLGLIGVAVSDTPAGEFKFIGHVKFPDGHRWGDKHGEDFPFDPGVLVDDDGRIYLYSGFSENIPSFLSGFRKLKNRGGVVVELEKDMVTIKKEPVLLFPKMGKDSFPGHEFYEASSIRKIKGSYYFIYSSVHNHELCYAISNKPTEGFKFGGTLVSIGDIFINNITNEKKGVNYLGNTHGGLLYLNNKWFIFYHRQTNRHSYSRQGCAEELIQNDNGYFKQAEVTSCGLNSGPLRGKGEYRAYIACNLWSKKGVGRYDLILPRIRLLKHPYFTQDSHQYIKNMRNGSVAGFKYFELKSLKNISITIRGRGKGCIIVSSDWNIQNIVSKIEIEVIDKKSWTTIKSNSVDINGVHPLFFKFVGSGSIDFYSFNLYP